MNEGAHPQNLTVGEVQRNVEETRDQLNRQVERLDGVIRAEVGALNRAVDNNRLFSQWAVGLLALIFTGLSIYAAWSIASQTSMLSEFRKFMEASIAKDREQLEAEITRQLGAGTPPSLATCDVRTLEPLAEGAVVPLQRHADSQQDWYSFRVILRNEGGSTTGPIYSKVVTKDSLRLPEPSSSEPDYEFETVIEPEDEYGDAIPAGMSRGFDYILDLLQPPPPGDHTALLIHYYGKNQSSRHVITLRLQ